MKLPTLGKRSAAFLFSTSALVCAMQPMDASAQQNAFTIAKVLTFSKPTKAQRSMLAKVGGEDIREIVKDQFAIAAADLNDDGKDELIVSSMSMGWCGSLGCWSYILEKSGAKWIVLTNFQTDGGIGITNEKTGGYRAIAILDRTGKIATIDRERHGPSIIQTAPKK